MTTECGGVLFMCEQNRERNLSDKIGESSSPFSLQVSYSLACNPNLSKVWVDRSQLDGDAAIDVGLKLSPVLKRQLRNKRS